MQENKSNIIFEDSELGGSVVCSSIPKQPSIPGAQGWGVWAIVTTKIARRELTCYVWDLGLHCDNNGPRVQGFSAEVISDQMSVTPNILAAVWRVYWRVGRGNGETEAQRNQATCPRTQHLL